MHEIFVFLLASNLWPVHAISGLHESRYERSSVVRCLSCRVSHFLLLPVACFISCLLKATTAGIVLCKQTTSWRAFCWDCGFSKRRDGVNVHNIRCTHKIPLNIHTFQQQANIFNLLDDSIIGGSPLIYYHLLYKHCCRAAFSSCFLSPFVRRVIQ